MTALLRRGSRGPEVGELQAALNFHLRRATPPLVPDGIFGPKTQARLCEFQRMACIASDGLAGPQTRRKLYRALKGTIDVALLPPDGPDATTGQPVSLRPRALERRRPAAAPGLAPGPERPSPSPQVRTFNPRHYDFESGFTFSPLDPDQPYKLRLTLMLPWPVLLPKPLKLELDQDLSSGSLRKLDGKVKIPFSLVDWERFSVTPYFFAGAGLGQYGFSNVNTGAVASLKLKLAKLGHSGLVLSAKADGGAKFEVDLDKGYGKVKGILNGGLFLEGRF